MKAKTATTVLYLCDQKRCKNCDVRRGIADKTGWACKHTFDIRHAKNWKSQPPKKTLEKHFIFTNNGFENVWMEKEE